MSSNNTPKTTAPHFKRTDPRPNNFAPGINPFTGKTALRAQVYEVLKNFPNTEMTAKDIAHLLGEDFAKVGVVLAQLLDQTQGYPNIHRPSMGKYLYDPTRPTSAVRFPTMSKKARDRKKRETARAAAAAAAAVPTTHIDVPSTTPAPVVTASVGTVVLDRFVEVLPVIDTEARTIKVSEVLLRDLDGSLWLASKVN